MENLVVDIIDNNLALDSFDENLELNLVEVGHLYDAKLLLDEISKSESI